MATQRKSSVLRFQLEGVEGPGVEIGRGSYAVVEEYDFLGLSCVGKSIHKELYDNAYTRERETMLERFEGECEMLSRLCHPHIIQFLGVHFNKHRRRKRGGAGGCSPPPTPEAGGLSPQKFASTGLGNKACSIIHGLPNSRSSIVVWHRSVSSLSLLRLRGE